MLDRVAQVPLSEASLKALRMLTSEQGVMIRDRATLLDLEAKGLVRQSTEGWVVTIAGHLRLLKALTDAL